MKNTLSDILREADPLRSESRSPEARERLRRAVLAAPRGESAHRRNKRLTLATAVIIAVASLAVARLSWRQLSVDAVAAVQFEARLAESGQAILSNRDVLT